MLGLDVVRRGLVASLPDAQGICWVGQPSEAAMADFFFKRAVVFHADGHSRLGLTLDNTNFLPLGP